jgi:uncharacterized protein (DUF433 family)
MFTQHDSLCFASEVVDGTDQHGGETMKAFVEINPQVLGGEPVVQGTRISVYVLADLIAQGAQPGEILQDYPSLTDETLKAGLAFAQAHPRPQPCAAPWRNGVVIRRLS